MESRRDREDVAVWTRGGRGERNPGPGLSPARLPASARVFTHRRADTGPRARRRQRPERTIRIRRRRDPLPHVAGPAAVLARVTLLSRLPALAAERQSAPSSLTRGFLLTAR